MGKHDRNPLTRSNGIAYWLAQVRFLLHIVNKLNSYWVNDTMVKLRVKNVTNLGSHYFFPLMPKYFCTKNVFKSTLGDVKWKNYINKASSFQLSRGEIWVANFIPSVSGASQGSCLLTKVSFSLKMMHKLTHSIV